MTAPTIRAATAAMGSASQLTSRRRHSPERSRSRMDAPLAVPSPRLPEPSGPGAWRPGRGDGPPRARGLRDIMVQPGSWRESLHRALLRLGECGHQADRSAPGEWPGRKGPIGPGGGLRVGRVARRQKRGEAGPDLGGAMTAIEFTLNGTPVATDVRDDETLLDVLRERL